MREDASDHDGCPSIRFLNCRCMHAHQLRTSGASLASGTRTATFLPKAGSDRQTRMRPQGRSCGCSAKMDAEHSPLRDIVGRKLMFGNTTSARRGKADVRCRECSFGPGERPIVGAGGQANDVGVVVDALASCLGWETNGAQRENVRTRLSGTAGRHAHGFVRCVPVSFAGGSRLAIMGFKSQQELCSYLEERRLAGSDLRCRISACTLQGARQHC